MLSRHESPTIDAVRGNPGQLIFIKWWAAFGAFITGVGLWAMGTWVLSDDFKRIPVGADPVPTFMVVGIRVFETLSVIAFLLALYLVVYRQWKRERRMTFDGLFCLAIFATFWQDEMLNVFQRQVTFNAAFLNWGGWFAHIPGWLSPDGGKFAAPILIYPMYAWGLFGSIVLGNLVMRRVARQVPNIGRAGLLATCFVFMLVVEGICEPLALRFGAWSYAGSIRSLTLFPGHYYQFPLYQWVFTAALLTGWSALRYFRDDSGRAFPEQGVEALRLGGRSKTAMRFFALVGACTAIFALTYHLPMSILGLYAGEWPKDVTQRSYLTNGYCGPGTRLACPGPNIPIIRRGSLRVSPDGEVVDPHRILDK